MIVIHQSICTLCFVIMVSNFYTCSSPSFALYCSAKMIINMIIMAELFKLMMPVPHHLLLLHSLPYFLQGPPDHMHTTCGHLNSLSSKAIKNGLNIIIINESGCSLIRKYGIGGNAFFLKHTT